MVSEKEPSTHLVYSTFSSFVSFDLFQRLWRVKFDSMLYLWLIVLCGLLANFEGNITLDIDSTVICRMSDLAYFQAWLAPSRDPGGNNPPCSRHQYIFQRILSTCSKWLFYNTWENREYDPSIIFFPWILNFRYNTQRKKKGLLGIVTFRL